jgi:hypothetical protein
MSRSVTGSDRTFRLSPIVRRAMLVGLASIVPLACGKDDGPRLPLSDISGTASQLPSGHPSLDPGPGLPAMARSALDSANAAFRVKDYRRALQFYRQAANAAPTHASPWFGVFMVAQATGNTALRDSAQREVQKRTVDPPALTDSTLRNTHPTAKKGPTT